MSKSESERRSETARESEREDKWFIGEKKKITDIRQNEQTI